MAGNANALLNHRTVPNHQHEPTGATAKGSLLRLATAVAKTLKVAISPGDFLSARIFRKASATAAKGPNDHLDLIKSTFAVVCKDHGVVARILAAERSHGVMRYSELDPAGITNPDLAEEQPGNPIVNVNELLPSNVLKPLTEAETELKPAGFKYIWTRNFTVYVKFINDSPVQTVNFASDLPVIAQLYSQNLPGSTRN